MFLQKLFSPKWKHKNPSIRKEALEALNPGKEDTQKIFAEVVKVDNDITIRRMVVGRLRDMELLQYLQQTQEQLADSAGKRIRQLIAGTAPYAIDYAIRKQNLEKTTDQETVEYVAREAEDAQLRSLAVEKVQRQSLLGDLAVDDADQDVRLKALEKITQISTLERVYKNSRLKDKRISALAKERLDALTSELERPKVLKKQAKQCCLDLESLVQRCIKSGQWLSAKTRFDALQNTWQATKAQWQDQYGKWDEALTVKFGEFRAQFEQRYQLKQQEDAQKRAQEEKAEPFKAQKRKLCEDLEEKLAQVKSMAASEVPQPQEQLQPQLQAVKVFLADLDQLWQNAQQALAKEDARSAEHEEINHRFHLARNELNDYIKDLQTCLRYHHTLSELVEKSAALVSNEEALDSAAVATVQKAHEKLATPKHFPVDESLGRQIKENLRALSQRLEAQEKQKQANINEFTALAGELGKALQAGKTKHGANLANRGKKLLGMIPQSDRRLLQKNKSIKQFNEALKQLNELQSWRQWSNAPVKEQLCRQMQQLAQQVTDNQDNPDFDFPDAAQRVKEARAEWKKITAAEPNASNDLWEAFDAACTQAYEPCQRYFEQQSEVRAQNLQRRESACVALEEYLEVLSHKPTDLIDWKALDNIVQVAQEEWRTLGVVERNDRAAINKRFRNVINALRKFHLDQKNRNKEEKEILIKRAEGIAKQLEEEKISLRDAVESIKQVQADWKAVGIAVSDGALWKQFRAGCDKVFQRREQETAAVRQERQSAIDARAAICEAIENLATLEGDALKAAQKDFDDLKQQWSALPSLQKPAAQKSSSKSSKQEPLEKRFRDASRAFEVQNQLRIKSEDEQRVRTQQLQAQLCRQGEDWLFRCLQQQIPVEQCRQEVAQLDIQWRQLPEYSHNVNKALQQRFDNLNGLLQQANDSGVETVAEDIRQQQPTRLADKQLLCLQMEVLANIESPPEAQQARMEYQVSQLAEKMKQASSTNIISEIEELQAKWYLSGVIEGTLHQALESRFERACQALNVDA
jgi:hypothetical protein